jgi:hypothetical protein
MTRKTLVEIIRRQQEREAATKIQALARARCGKAAG